MTFAALEMHPPCPGHRQASWLHLAGPLPTAEAAVAVCLAHPPTDRLRVVAIAFDPAGACDWIVWDSVRGYGPRIGTVPVLTQGG